MDNDLRFNKSTVVRKLWWLTQVLGIVKVGNWIYPYEGPFKIMGSPDRAEIRGGSPFMNRSDGEKIICSLFSPLKRTAVDRVRCGVSLWTSSPEVGCGVRNKGSTLKCVGIMNISKRYVLSFGNVYDANIQLNRMNHKHGLEQYNSR